MVRYIKHLRETYSCLEDENGICPFLDTPFKECKVDGHTANKYKELIDDCPYWKNGIIDIVHEVEDCINCPYGLNRCNTYYCKNLKLEGSIVDLMEACPLDKQEEDLLTIDKKYLFSQGLDDYYGIGSCNDCCGCGDCGEHEHTLWLDNDTKLVITWNTWRAYINSVELLTWNEDKHYYDTILYFMTGSDVTHTKQGYLDTKDRKFVMMKLLDAIMQLKKMKLDNDKEQTKLKI